MLLQEDIGGLEEAAVDQSIPSEERAVVLGFGMAGLAAVAALREHFAQIVVIDRDPVPSGSELRRGVPQGNQLHSLLAGAQQNLEALLPGYGQKLNSYGAGRARVASQTHIFTPGGEMPLVDFGFDWVTAWRPHMEQAAQDLLAQKSNIVFRGLSQAVGLNTKHNAVSGVLLVDKHEQRVEEIAASLVVDATGARSHAPAWLDEAGLHLPVMRHTTNQWFAGMLFARPADYKEEDTLWISPPNNLDYNSAVVAPYDADHWYISVSGRSEGRLPQTVEDMQAHATRLPGGKVIADLIDRAYPLDEVTRTYPMKTFRRAYYERLKHQPLRGFIPIGDAILTLSPAFGQGITVASYQARILDAVLREHRYDSAMTTKKYLHYALAVAQQADAISSDRAVDPHEAGDPGEDFETLYKNTMSDLHMITPAPPLDQILPHVKNRR